MEDVIEKTDVESSVESYLGTPEFTLQRVVVQKFSEKTLGFLGRHFKITADVKLQGETQKLNFFAKIPPVTVTDPTKEATSKYFVREVFIYSELLPKMNSALPPGTTLPVPKCVLSRLAKDGDSLKGSREVDERLIILEDVTHKGYRLIELGKPMDLVHCHCVLKALSRFHASSILLKESFRIPHTNDSAPDGMFPNDILNWPGDTAWAQSCAESMASAVSKIWPDRFKDKEEEVLGVLTDSWEKIFVMSRVSSKYTNVLCHIDLWSNNMLFAYDSKRDLGIVTPVDVLFVDFQLVRHAPPALDIVTFFYLCTDKKFRDENFKGLLEYYYSCMREYVSNEVLERVFPFSSLVESVEEFMEYGVVMSTAYIPIILEELVPRRTPEIGHNDLMDGWMKDRGHQIAWNCSQSYIYGERVKESFMECLQRLSLWSPCK